MSKFKINIDWNKAGSEAISLLRSNAGTLVGAISMIGCALLCKKLDLPYQILTDPYDFGNYSNVTQFNNKVNDNSLILVPNNTIEASIGAICDNARNNIRDGYYKAKSVDKIMNILSENDGSLTESTKTYAIMCIRSIANSCNDNYYRNRMMDKIADIANNDF